MICTIDWAGEPSGWARFHVATLEYISQKNVWFWAIGCMSFVPNRYGVVRRAAAVYPRTKSSAVSRSKPAGMASVTPVHELTVLSAGNSGLPKPALPLPSGPFGARIGLLSPGVGAPGPAVSPPSLF